MNAENLVPRGWNFCQMLRDQSLGDLDNLPEPDEIAEEIIENLEAGLESFRGVLSELQTER